MKILVFGAGPLGSLFAARLDEAGHDVSVLARGQRLRDLREHGVVLENAITGEVEISHPNIVETLAPEDAYDLIMVVMRKNQAMQILPTLAANKPTPTILFMMNNAAGQDQLIQALGKARIMLGFPLPGGERVGHIIHTLPADEQRQWTLPVGEVSGQITQRTRQVAQVLESMRGYNVEIRTDMDAWLKYHVAVVMPLACAIYAADLDAERTARTRDVLVLAVRAFKEAMAGLQNAGVPVSPAILRILAWLPEPFLVWLYRWGFRRPELAVSGVGHARAARDEMQYLADELLQLLHAHGAQTPVFNQLYTYLDPATPPMPDASREIPVNWRSVWIMGLAKLSFIVFLLIATRRACRKASTPDQKLDQKEETTEEATEKTNTSVAV